MIRDMRELEVVIVGSGFAGTILGRVLALAGRSVLIVERARHPRFALGESSTPLAAIALERLAAREGCGDLGALAAAGRWGRELPELRRGVKRGFTFYRQRAGEPFANGEDNEARLLVAASPDEEIADAHWLRADVDAYLARRAVEAGAVLWEGCELEGVEIAGGVDGTGVEGDGPVRLTGRRTSEAGIDERVEVSAEFVVDGSGVGGLLARQLGLGSAETATPETELLFGHFAGVRRFADVARGGGAAMPAGPYEDDRAAVHHVLDEGWMYVLRFDPEDAAGRAPASAGFVLRRAAAAELAGLGPEAAFAEMLRRYPSLAATFAGARPVRPVGRVARLARRTARSHGRRWLLLPHAYAFFDPLFSTGIAWSLAGVERAAELLAGAGPPPAAGLERYGRLLAAEADHLDRLVAGAWAAMPNFALVAAHAQLYFAAASFCEARQRLVPGEHAWDGFLGATDPVLGGAAAEALRRLGATPRSPGAPRPAAAAFARWAAGAIAPRNVAGLADPARRNLYPVDLEALVAAAPLLGLSHREIRAALPRLRGGGAPERVLSS
jgi:tetracycline 7-halogenase / FADH2 O2-dependent halogenase